MKTLTKIYLYLSVVFMPIAPTLIWLGALIFIDLVMGIWKSKKKKEKITSRKLSHTVTKLVLYLLAVVVCHIVDTQFLTLDWLPATSTQLVAGFLAVIELKSIMENISDILGIQLWEWIKNKLNRRATEESNTDEERK